MSVQAYWNNNGTYQGLVEMLHELIPFTGAVEHARSKNKELDRFRRAANAYYDLFNNGGCNRGAEIRKIFNLRQRDYYGGSPYKCRQSPDFEKAAKIVDPIMDQLVLAAAVEQGLCTEETALSTAVILK